MAKYGKLDKSILTNIREAYFLSSYEEKFAGMDWYILENAFCFRLSVKHKISIQAACGVVAALSPGQEWERNKTSADKLLNAVGNKEPIPPGVSVYGRLAIFKAEEIALGGDPINVLSGPKVTAFYACLVDPWNTDAVCIDRHARTLALVLDPTEENARSMGVSEIKWIGKHYVKVAKELSIKPCQLQAILWVYWKNKHKK